MKPNRRVAVWMLVMFCATGLAVDAQSRVAGKVVGITDGDTITVLDQVDRQIKVRLVGIDAPERKQDFGNRSRQFLTELVMSQYVLLDGNKTDRNGRLIAKVLLNGKDTGLELIKAGLAWHFKQFAYEQTSDDRKIYSNAEVTARQHRVGIWSMPESMAPWDFRKKKTIRPAPIVIASPPG